MEPVGKYLVFVGLALAAIGALLVLGQRVPWLGRLPGDIAIETPRVRFYFPIVTSLLLSLLLTLAFRLFKQ